MTSCMVGKALGYTAVVYCMACTNLFDRSHRTLSCKQVPNAREYTDRLMQHHWSKWGFEIKKVLINHAGISTVTASLLNKSDKGVRISRSMTRRSLGVGTRIWPEQFDQYYRMKEDESTLIHYDEEYYEVKAGAAIVLEFNCETANPKPGRMLYSLCSNLNTELRIEKKPKNIRLEDGAYVIDAVIDLRVYDEETGDYLGIVTVPTENKVRVLVGS